MDTNRTIRRNPRPVASRQVALRLIAGSALLSGLASGQLSPRLAQGQAPVGSGQVPAGSAWRKLGNHSVGMNLAGPAGGPIDSVWFSQLGDRLYARTRAGQVFETSTSDFTSWFASKNPSPSGPPTEMGLGPQNTTIRSPEPGAKIITISGDAGRIYALAANLHVSDDYGRTWSNLTAYQRNPVIGPHQHSVAISPDRQQLVVANDYGLWRSADRGLSWSGLNEDLPNLPIRRILPSASPGTIRAEIAGIGAVELSPAAAAARANWILAADSTDSTQAQRLAIGKALGTKITAFAKTSTTWFAGSIDGFLWSSRDNGATWNISTDRAAGPIAAIQTAGDTDSSAGALAVAGLPTVPGATGPRILRTVNGGLSWEDLGAGLPDGELHGVALDAVSSVAYVAGDRGVFNAHVDMNNPVPVSQWQRVSGLPEAPAMDVRLDHIRNMLYVALDGYGLYAAPAPHKSTAIRVLTAADQPAQTAAPGVLLNVQGSDLSRVRAEGSELAILANTTSSTQVQVPFEVSGSTLALTMDSAHGTSQVSLPLKAVAPSILLDGDSLPILVDSATGLTLDARNAAHPGSRIQVFAAGLGRVSPEWRAGIPAPDDPPAVVARVEARLNGNPVEVTRATLAPGYIGLYQVEVQLPGLVNAGAADLSLIVNGDASNHVRILLTVE